MRIRILAVMFILTLFSCTNDKKEVSSNTEEKTAMVENHEGHHHDHNQETSRKGGIVNDAALMMELDQDINALIYDIEREFKTIEQ